MRYKMFRRWSEEAEARRVCGVALLERTNAEQCGVAAGNPDQAPAVVAVASLVLSIRRILARGPRRDAGATSGCPPPHDP